MQKQWDGSELGLLRNERSVWPSRAAEWERGGRQREGGRWAGPVGQGRFRGWTQSAVEASGGLHTGK